MRKLEAVDVLGDVEQNIVSHSVMTSSLLKV